MYYILNINKQAEIENYQATLDSNYFFVVTVHQKIVESFTTDITTYNNYTGKTSFNTTRPVFVIEAVEDAYIASLAEYATADSFMFSNSYLNQPDGLLDV